MKKIRIKPLETLHPKFDLGWLFISLVMALGVSSCSDDDDDTPSFQFPEKQTVHCSAADTRELTFEANAAWSLTSSELWCRFLVDGTEEYSLSGNAGKQTVNIVISDESQKPEMTSVAHLTLMIGDSKAIIADIVRNAPSYEFKITDEQGNELQVLEAGYDGFIRFNAEANFRFATTDRPDWVAVEGGSIVGTPGKVIKGGLQIVTNGNREKYPIEREANHTITFSDENGLAVYTYPIVYKGMNPNAIIVNGPEWFNWEVSLDGRTFMQTATSGVDGTATTLTYNKFVPFTVQALNDDYVPIYIQQVEEYGIIRLVVNSDEEPVDWIHLVDKDHNGNARLTVDESYDGSEREGYVLVFPRSEYDRIMADGINGFYEEVITSDENCNQVISYKYEQSNLLIHFVQRKKKETGGEEAAFKVTYFNMETGSMDEISLTKVTDEAIISEYGIDVIYSLPQPDIQMGFNVDPMMEGYANETWFFQAYQDNKMLDDDSIVCEDGKNLSVWLPEPISKDIYILIKDQATWTNKKILIITPNN